MIKLSTQKTGHYYEFLNNGVIVRSWNEISDDYALSNMRDFIGDYITDLKFSGKLFECDFKVKIVL